MIHEKHWDFRSPYYSHWGQCQHFKLIALVHDQGHGSQPESWHDSSRCLCTTVPGHLPWYNQSLSSTFLRMVHVSFRLFDWSASALQFCRASQALLDLSVWTTSDLHWDQTSCSYKDTGYFRYLTLGVQICIWNSKFRASWMPTMDFNVYVASWCHVVLSSLGAQQCTAV